MKYNKDIHPIKKQIGLKLEKLLKDNPIVFPEHRFVTVDSRKAVEFWEDVPDHSSDFYWSPILADIYQVLYDVDFTNNEKEYIENNWRDLIFRLGEKE
jgi:hypothetical protein